jgi:hypothetical protein
MPSIESYFPKPESKYLKHADLGGKDVIVTIAGVDSAAFKNDDGSEQAKPMLRFREVPKALVLNKTNATTLAMLLGDDTDEWGGAKITLNPTKVSFKGSSIDTIRIKRAPKAA